MASASPGIASMRMKTTCLSGTLCLLLTACEPKIDYNVDGPTVTAQDFTVIEGDWVGTLTYTDYSSGKPTVIASHSSVTSVSDTEINYTISYPDEPWEDTVLRPPVDNGTLIVPKLGNGAPLVFVCRGTTYHAKSGLGLRAVIRPKEKITNDVCELEQPSCNRRHMRDSSATMRFRKEVLYLRTI